MQDKHEAIWTALDDLALEIGQPDIVRQLLAENRRLMLTYRNLFEQKAQVQQAPNGHQPKATPTAL